MAQIWQFFCSTLCTTEAHAFHMVKFAQFSIFITSNTQTSQYLDILNWTVLFPYLLLLPYLENVIKMQKFTVDPHILGPQFHGFRKSQTASNNSEQLKSILNGAYQLASSGFVGVAATPLYVKAYKGSLLTILCYSHDNGIPHNTSFFQRSTEV